MCGREKEAKTELLDGILVFTFPKACSYCAGTNKTSKNPGYRDALERAEGRYVRREVKKRAKRVRKAPKKLTKGQRRKELLKNAPGGPYESKRYDGRAEVYDFMCAYCDENEAVGYDHAIPISRGGTNWPSNIYPACNRCNTEKGAQVLYREWTPPNRRN